jgi:hypothetical protein
LRKSAVWASWLARRVPPGSRPGRAPLARTPTWAALREGFSPIIPDLHRGLGSRLDTPTRAEKRLVLLDMALGVFSSAGVVHLRVQREADVSNVGDLLLYSLDDLEDIAAKKGEIRMLLDEKWCKVYKANSPRGLFERGELAAWYCTRPHQTFNGHGDTMPDSFELC